MGKDENIAVGSLRQPERQLSASRSEPDRARRRRLAGRSVVFLVLLVPLPADSTGVHGTDRKLSSKVVVLTWSLNAPADCEFTTGIKNSSRRYRRRISETVG